MINLIWAMDKNGLIGKGNKLPWRILAEMKYFAQITSGSVVLMGSKTFESIGKILKNRLNIVITKNKLKYQNQKAENLVFADNLKEILEPYKENPDKHIFIIGGREIYQQTYALADYYYVSLIKGGYKGNVYFPFPEQKKSEKQENSSLEKLLKGCKLIKKEEFPDFTAYVYLALTKTS